MVQELPEEPPGGCAMERTRDLINGNVTLDYFVKMAAEGWTLSAVEWVREGAHTDIVEASSRTEQSMGVRLRVASEEIPYALQIAEDGQHLEPNPLERTVLLLILDKIVHEKRVTQIAAELNADGHKTRKGMPWTPSDVFNLLPRVIEAGPDLLKSPEWQQHQFSPSQPM